MSIRRAFTVHDAQVAVWHAWGDGTRVMGPVLRHLEAPAARVFRAGLTIKAQSGPDASAAFADWRRHAPAEPWSGGWTVEASSVLGDEWEDAAAVSQMIPPGAPVVIVVRFAVKGSGEWRVLQFHDAVFEPVEAGEDGQVMRRSLRFSAGWMEEFKSGDMPGLEPRVRGVIEWRHLGRTVRCWEYDPEADTWAEDPENVSVVGGDTVRYVSLDFDAGAVVFSMLAAMTDPATIAGTDAAGIAWRDVVVFTVPVSGGLELDAGWTLEAQGCAEPLLLPESGRHWEHPRAVFRVLGRIHATARAGVLAMPALTDGVPESPIDLPLRLGRLRLYPDGGWLES